MTRDWQRIGAVSGILFFVLVIASFFTPGTQTRTIPLPRSSALSPTTAPATWWGSTSGGSQRCSSWCSSGALWSRLRAAEADRGPSILVALGGVGTAVIVLVGNAALMALVDAADQGREPEAVRALFELDLVFLLGIGWTSAAFYVGAALSSLATGSLPRWLGWIAAVLALAFVVGFLGIFSEGDEGGVLGYFFFAALVVNFLWILAASIVMLRARPAGSPSPGH